MASGTVLSWRYRPLPQKGQLKPGTPVCRGSFYLKIVPKMKSARHRGVHRAGWVGHTALDSGEFKPCVGHRAYFRIKIKKTKTKTPDETRPSRPPFVWLC